MTRLELMEILSPLRTEFYSLGVQNLHMLLVHNYRLNRQPEPWEFVVQLSTDRTDEAPLNRLKSLLEETLAKKVKVALDQWLDQANAEQDKKARLCIFYRQRRESATNPDKIFNPCLTNSDKAAP